MKLYVQETRTIKRHLGTPMRVDEGFYLDHFLNKRANSGIFLFTFRSFHNAKTKTAHFVTINDSINDVLMNRTQDHRMVDVYESTELYGDTPI